MEWVTNTDDSALPTTIVRVYRGRTQEDTTRSFALEADLLAGRGYVPTAQSWADGRAGLGRALAIGLYSNVLRPDGSLTVTYTRDGRTTEGKPVVTRRTKRCPDCAEDVLVEARVCRFCRYVFDTTTGGASNSVYLSESTEDPPPPRKRQ